MHKKPLPLLESSHGMDNTPPSLMQSIFMVFVVYIASSGSFLSGYGLMVVSPNVTIESSFLSGFSLNLNVAFVHSMGEYSPPPSFGNIGKASFKVVV